MKDLLKKKQEVFDKQCYHIALAHKHEREARKWRQEEQHINYQIRELEQELREPIKLVYAN